ncbi:LacI family DNA-binding transcriptional regulator [Lactiplantibacillus fabifermentans]|uniref:Bacterial regulatory s, lacI family protein n=2 Tax=Lactiplantibacillus fabifermentans TaxID=483011 RepID=A0A0R2NRI7_9LACO|nr:LacI family DNA-binding transcriptional regulator [Lactiplantibacillus fabifermentans]ETY73245.1 LacI family transcription regulator [Lactiplantibacillus fabifermentans T30PCM01]KRO28321.1 bacterial regulatory s, lacI family protein [Lactiplantibacillus fabifermentans DSM 21115]
MTNIRDIARLSGYSVSTVSRVINRQNYVSEATRTAIQKVVDELDYVPNAVARDLSRGRTQNVGVVLPHSDHPYFTQLVHGIMRAAFEANYHVVLLPSKYDAALELQYLEDLRQKAYDALIFTSHGLPLTELNHYRRYGSIVVCENPQRCPIPAAYAERQATYEAAFNHLKQRGANHIGILASRDVAISATTQAMVQAYQTVFGQPLAAAAIFTGVATPADGDRAGQYFLTQIPTVDAVLTNGDDIAVGMLRAYRRAGVKPPYLIGQEHQLAGEALNLPTIDHHFEEVGARAFKLAITGQTQNVAIPSEFLLPK